MLYRLNYHGSLPFMEPDCSSPCSQEHGTGTYPEPY